jgi:hypothetical protein
LRLEEAVHIVEHGSWSQAGAPGRQRAKTRLYSGVGRGLSGPLPLRARAPPPDCGEKRSKGLNDNQSWCMLEMSCVGVVLEFRVVCVEVCGLCESRSGVNRMAYGGKPKDRRVIVSRYARTSLVGESNYATFGEDGVLRTSEQAREQAGSGKRVGRVGPHQCCARVAFRARTVLRKYYDPASWLTYV